jgi:NADPH:quinone reductase-like Zn-dependent oxidoreductase
VFTLLPLLTGEQRAHHGEILARAARLAEEGRLKPLLADRRYTPDDAEAAYADVEAGSFGKVVVEILSPLQIEANTG